MNINLQAINAKIEEGYINVQKHPTLDLWLYNYSPSCQYDKEWTPETMMCRGLILDGQGNIVARPFSKFFNLQEHESPDLPPIPIEPYVAYEKFDGSLGIYYLEDGQPTLATRGSFRSEQAIKGTQMLRDIDFTPEDGVTPLFEIIYPENRIVVDYGDEEKLVLLGYIDKETGEFVEPYGDESFAIAPKVEIDLHVVESRENKEGFVIHFQSGLMVKLKFNEYVRLHRLVTMVNAKTIWDLLRNKQSFDELLDRVPDEYYKWVKSIEQELVSQYKQIENEAISSFEKIGKKENRKDFAIEAVKTKYAGILFSILDGKDYSQTIWKLIKPEATKPFREKI